MHVVLFLKSWRYWKVNALLCEIEFWMTNRFKNIICCCILIINSFYSIMWIFVTFFSHDFSFSFDFFSFSTEFCCSWFKSIEYNGCFSASAARYRAIHWTLFDFIGEWCTQFGEFTLWIQFNTGFDRSLRKMLVSVWTSDKKDAALLTIW